MHGYALTEYKSSNSKGANQKTLFYWVPWATPAKKVCAAFSALNPHSLLAVKSLLPFYSKFQQKVIGHECMNFQLVYLLLLQPAAVHCIMHIEIDDRHCWCYVTIIRIEYINRPHFIIISTKPTVRDAYAPACLIDWFLDAIFAWTALWFGMDSSSRVRSYGTCFGLHSSTFRPSWSAYASCCRIPAPPTPPAGCWTGWMGSARRMRISCPSKA